MKDSNIQNGCGDREGLMTLIELFYNVHVHPITLVYLANKYHHCMWINYQELLGSVVSKCGETHL